MRDMLVVALATAAGAIAGAVATRWFGGIENLAREAVRKATAENESEASRIVEKLRGEQRQVAALVADLESADYKTRASALIDDLEARSVDAEEVVDQSGLATSGSGWLRVGDTQFCWGRGTTRGGAGTLSAEIEFAMPFVDEHAFSVSVTVAEDAWQGVAINLRKGRTNKSQRVALRPSPIDDQPIERPRNFDWVAIGKWR